MPPIDRTRTICIWGPARCGTTVLQNALNSSGEVYIFGEPGFESDWSRPGFAQRYNEKHVGFGNQVTKSTYFPPILHEDATAAECFTVLANHYRWVGAKLTIGPLHDDGHELFGFVCRHFYGGVNLCILRRPSLAISSVERTWGIRDLRSWHVSFVQAWLLSIKVYRNLPRAHYLFADWISPQTFGTLAQVLGGTLEHAPEHYRDDRQYHGVPTLSFKSLDLCYEKFRDLFNPVTLQLEKDVRGLEQKRSGDGAFGLGEIQVWLTRYLQGLTEGAPSGVGEASGVEERSVPQMPVEMCRDDVA